METIETSNLLMPREEDLVSLPAIDMQADESEIVA